MPAKIAALFVGAHTKYKIIPKTVLRFDRERGTIHPTQKPVPLLEYLIRSYSRPGDLVLDPCAGSGSAAIAAMNTSRKFVGFEKDRGIFDMAVKRIAERENRAEPA